jgi:hypothetical protein
MLRIYNFLTKHPVLSFLSLSFLMGITVNIFISIIIFYVKHYDHMFKEFNDGTDLQIFGKDYNLSILPYVIIISMIRIFIFFYSDIEFHINSRNKLILNLGLRKLYKNMKRLPMFICKHCLKTIIVKNIDIVCPFCDAEFRVTDEENTKQIGDVFAKGVRNIVNESTIEKIIFYECPACNGKIRHIDCYHCGKEIDLFEDYNEIKLERKRYGEI